MILLVPGRASETAARRATVLDSDDRFAHLCAMTGSELRDMLIREITRAHGGSTSRWRRAVGQPKIYSRTTHAHCNWEVRPAGSVYEVAIIERAADDLRNTYPYVDGV